MAALAVPATFAVAFAYLKAPYDQRRRLRREVGDAFDIPDDAFRRHFPSAKKQCGGCATKSPTNWNWGARGRLRCVGGAAGLMRSAFLRHRLVPIIGGERGDHFRNAASGQQGVIGCVDGGFVAIVVPRGKQKAAFFCRKGYYALNVMFICDADMRILAVDPLRPGSDHDSHIWGTSRLRERFADGRIDTNGEYIF
ncbi:hypothetical protein MTO96_041502, partial [Rhipicephalus appendiculatus]